jgi:hypothetical protein
MRLVQMRAAVETVLALDGLRNAVAAARGSFG